MYAIIKNGGKQYKVKQDEILNLEKIDRDVGEKIEFNEVLMLQTADETKIGSPVIENAKVEAEIIQQGRDKKIKIIKFRRRKQSLKRQGHRQYFTKVKILSIGL